MNRGEVMHVRDDDRGPWERVRVLVPFGAGVGGVVAVFERIDAGGRYILFEGGEWVTAS